MIEWDKTTKIEFSHGSFSGQVGEVTEVHGDMRVITFNGPRLAGAEIISVFDLKWFGAKKVQ